MRNIRSKETVITPIERVGKVYSIGEEIQTNQYKCLKIVVDIYEGSLNKKPYKLEFYCYDREVISDASNLSEGESVRVRYKTRSKVNERTGLYYTNNICTKIYPITEEQILTFNF